MKTTLRGYAVACLTALMILGSACTNEDNTPSDKKETVDNPELLMALKTKGFKVEGSTVTLTPKELKMTELDLSGAGLKSLKGLEIFPMLTSVNLENNNFGDSIDFAQLPEKITSVDLAKNKIYKWKGLIKVNFNSTDANSAFKVLRQLKSLTLPYSARNDMEALPYYFTNKGAEKMMMENKEGQVEPYTTLREIPDPALKKYLTHDFSSVMTDEGKIDITKRLSTDQSSKVLLPYNAADVNDYEGIQYIIGNPFYKATLVGAATTPNKKNTITIEYLKPNKNVEALMFKWVNINHLDLSNAENIRWVRIIDANGLEILDLSHSKWLLQKDGAIENDRQQEINLYGCPNLKEIKLPEVKTPMPLRRLYLVNLPALEKINTENISGLSIFDIAKVPNLKSINLEGIKGYLDLETGKVVVDKQTDPDNQMSFNTTKETADNVKGLKEFYMRLGKSIDLFYAEYDFPDPEEGNRSYRDELSKKNYPPYDYTKDYTNNN